MILRKITDPLLGNNPEPTAPSSQPLDYGVSPELIRIVQRKIEEVASQRRTPLPTQDEITADLTKIAQHLEQMAEALMPETAGQNELCSCWFAIELLAAEKTKELDNGV